MKVGIVDYGVGNLGSVARALEELQAQPCLIDRASNIEAADMLILPGVGSFSECKAILDNGGWTSALRDAVLGRGVSLLGICLGMQLLATSSTEGAVDVPEVAGLGLIPGKVDRLVSLGCHDRTPHMGWNSVTWNLPSPIFAGIPSSTDFYFVHSYAFKVEDSAHLIATVDYGVPIAAVVGNDRVWGTQFHPEKSSKAGFRVLQNFIRGVHC